MDIIVLIKQVPDMEKVRFDREKGLVDRSSAEAEINPFDLNALEGAVTIRDMSGGSVTVITMGPPGAEAALRECLARGADRGILLCDPKFGGSDTKATSLTLSKAITMVGHFDLIFAGEKTVDGDTGQVGAEVAEYLGIPHSYYVSRIEHIGNGCIEVATKELGGHYIKEIRLPALLSVTKDLNTPRLPSFKDKMKARKAQIEKWSLNDMKNYISDECVGLQGSPTRVFRIEVPPALCRKCSLVRSEAKDIFIDELLKKTCKSNSTVEEKNG